MRVDRHADYYNLFVSRFEGEIYFPNPSFFNNFVFSCKMYAKYFTGFHINKNMYLLVTTDLRSFRSLPVKLLKISAQSDI